MIRTVQRLWLLVVVALLGTPALAAGEKKADTLAKGETTYICPNAAGGAVDCFLNAVEHLYTMCRQVKSIEIIEFGYEKSTEGTNGSKSEYCIDKHRVSIVRPYQLALREATGSRAAVDELRALYELWQKALVELKWAPGEKDDEYRQRVAKPYQTFSERATLVRAALSSPPAPAAPASPAKRGKASAAPAKRAN
jgi:hypothetical protein